MRSSKSTTVTESGRQRYLQSAVVQRDLLVKFVYNLALPRTEKKNTRRFDERIQHARLINGEKKMGQK